MQVSASASLDPERKSFEIGALRAAAPWRGVDKGLSAIDHEIALRALLREAEEYGADGIVEVTYGSEECPASEVTGLTFHRVVATGRAVKFALAA